MRDVVTESPVRFVTSDCCGADVDLDDLEYVGDAPSGANGRRDRLECKSGTGCRAEPEVLLGVL